MHSKLLDNVGKIGKLYKMLLKLSFFSFLRLKNQSLQSSWPTCALGWKPPSPESADPTMHQAASQPQSSPRCLWPVFCQYTPPDTDQFKLPMSVFEMQGESSMVSGMIYSFLVSEISFSLEFL